MASLSFSHSVSLPRCLLPFRPPSLAPFHSYLSSSTSSSFLPSFSCSITHSLLPSPLPSLFPSLPRFPSASSYLANWRETSFPENDCQPLQLKLYIQSALRANTSQSLLYEKLPQYNNNDHKSDTTPPTTPTSTTTNEK